MLAREVNADAMANEFRALVVEEQDGKVSSQVKTVAPDALPPDDVLIAVEYSDLNYKDGLALTGRNKVVRSYPMVPGIDLVGRVEQSDSPDWKPGDRVVSTGWGVGESHWGGYAERARLKSEWLVRVPDALSSQHAMTIGTAGFTAMLCIMALEEHGLAPDKGDVVVTGATGGVGGMAVALLDRLGYRVVAATGKADAADYLRTLGASDVLDRAELAAPGGPMGSARWAGAVDTVGGQVLAGVIRTLKSDASVAACGNAGGFDLPTSVLPFILRGVNLLGINSLPTPIERRRVAWARLAKLLPAESLDRMTARVAPLADLPTLADEILQGRVRGRVVVDVNA